MSVPCPSCGKHHQNQCHSCPHQADVKSRRYLSHSWEKTPCSACVAGGNGLAVNHKGRLHESLDSDKGNSEEVRLMLMSIQDTDEKPVNPLDEFLLFLVDLAELEPRQRDVVMLRTLHDLGRESWEYERIAARLGVTTQAAHQIHRRALEQSAVLRRVFAWKRTNKVLSVSGERGDRNA